MDKHIDEIEHHSRGNRRPSSSSVETLGRLTRQVSKSRQCVFIRFTFFLFQNDVTLQSLHKQIKEIQRPPEVASKTNYSRQKRKRDVQFLQNKLTVKEKVLIVEENTPVNMLSTRSGLKEQFLQKRKRDVQFLQHKLTAKEKVLHFQK